MLRLDVHPSRPSATERFSGTPGPRASPAPRSQPRRRSRASKRESRVTGAPAARPSDARKPRREMPAGGESAHRAEERRVGIAPFPARPAELDALLQRAAPAPVVVGEDLDRERGKPPEAVHVDDPGLPLGVPEVEGDGERHAPRELPREREAARPGRSRRERTGAHETRHGAERLAEASRRGGPRSSPRGPTPARRRHPPPPRPPAAFWRTHSSTRRRLPRRPARRWTRSWSEEVVTNSSRGSVAGSPA